MKPPKVLVMVLAGGRGERLFPLTAERVKPAVPFGGKYRMVDFCLSNMVNSGLFSIYVVVQYLSQSLIEHLRMCWHTQGMMRDHFITVVPPQMRLGDGWYRGTADAITQNLDLIEDAAPDVVAVVSADHVYRMDYRPMVELHIASGASVTVGAVRVPMSGASSFGIMEVDSGGRITNFKEKPDLPSACPGDPTRALASMGNYMFQPAALIEALTHDHTRSTDHDFGKTIIPDLVDQGRAFAFDGGVAPVPGLESYEDSGYWRDVGNLQAYWQAHMDLLGSKPLLNLANLQWPIGSASSSGSPARFIQADMEDALVAEGSTITRSRVRRSIIGRNVRIEEGCDIRDSVVMSHTVVGAGTQLVKAVVDRFNVIPRETVVDPDRAIRSHWFKDASGVFVLPRSAHHAGHSSLEAVT